MKTGRICDAFEGLRRSCEPPPAATAVEATEIIDAPPWHPRPECKITPIRRRVNCRRGGHRPVRLRIRKTAARIIFRLDREIGLATDKVRSCAFDLRCHFKFRTT